MKRSGLQLRKIKKLRRQAEEVVSREGNPPKRVTAEKGKRRIHELGVHQIESERQNEELRRARTEIEESRNKYVDLYDFAPVGYYTLASTGKILEVNLAGAKLLNLDRARIPGRLFSTFVAQDSRAVFGNHCLKVLEGGGKEDCELKMIRESGITFYASLESTAAADGHNGKIRAVVTDISDRKRAEEEVLRLNAEIEKRVEERTAQLEEANKQLRNRMAERKRSEGAERESEQRFHSLFENMYNGFAHCRMLYEKDQPRDFVYLNVNKAFERLTGLKNVVGKKVSEVIPGIQVSNPQLFEIYGRVALTGKPEKFEMYVDSLDDWFSISVYRPEKECFIAVFEVISRRKRAEEKQEATIELLRLCNKAGDSRELILDLMRYFRQITGCETVGVRLRAGDDFPYYETRGFPEEVVLPESSLCAIEQKGEMVRDNTGHPALDCMCGNILSGRFDPAKPFFTPHGSFWSGGITELPANMMEADRQAKTCNRCNGKGYESMALIPLRLHGETFGLFQFADKRRGRFTFKKIALLEELADYAAFAFSKLKSDEALREANRFNQQIISSAGEGVIVYGRDLRFQLWNPFMEHLSGVAAEEVLGKHPRDLFPFLREAGIIEKIERALAGQTSTALEFPYHYPQTGRSGWFSATYAPLRNTKGEIIGVIATVRDITERRQAEEARRESEERFSTIFHASPVAIAIARLEDGQLVDVNNTWEKVMGFSREEAIGHTAMELNLWVNPGDRDGMIKKMREQGAMREAEFQIRHKSGRVGVMLFSAELFELNGERFLLSLSQEVTQLKRVEEELRYRIEELEKMMDLAPVAIWVSNDPQCEHIAGNRMANRIYEAREGDNVSASPPLSQPPPPRRFFRDGRELTSQELPMQAAAAKDKEIRDAELNVVNLSGRRLTLRGSATPLHTPDGRVRGCIGAFMDITELKMAEEALRASERFRHGVIDGLSANIAVIDDTGTILSVNKAWREFADANPPVLRNICEEANYFQVCKSARGPDSKEAARFLDGVQKVLSDELAYFQMEYPCHSPDQERWFCVRVTPFPGDGPRRAVIAYQNITELKHAENGIILYQKKLQAMTSELALAEERERRRIAVELHDHIGQTLGLAKIKFGGLSRFNVSPELKSSLNEIQDMVDSIIQDTRSLIFEISSPVLYELGFETALEWLSEHFQERNGIPVELKIHGEPVIMREDLGTLFFQALRELLNNIIKHAEASQVKILFKRTKKEIRLTVEDDGVGFACSSEEFFLSKKCFGLFNIRERLDHIYGELKIESLPGKGTNVTLVAPLKLRAKRSKRSMDGTKNPKDFAGR